MGRKPGVDDGIFKFLLNCRGAIGLWGCCIAVMLLVVMYGLFCGSLCFFMQLCVFVVRVGLVLVMNCYFCKLNLVLCAIMLRYIEVLCFPCAIYLVDSR